MKRLSTMVAILLLISCVGIACEQGPTGSYIDMTTAAQMGDRNAFLNGFSNRSKDLVSALIGLSEAYGMEASNPYELLVFDSVEEEEVSADGETAILRVHRRGGSRRILMILEDGQWRIDTARLEAFWDEQGRN